MSENLVKIQVDGVELEARKGAMLIEVTDAAGIAIPRFCYHKKLSVAANCRMCLVDVERAPKPLPACATPVMDGMIVRTLSERAVDAQQGTMEFLLINHPLDCPICDQGGECELQDVAMGYGAGVSEFTERKRVVKDKDIGPLVATEMTRCIHCTRCVRFGDEIAGLRELGMTGRGEFAEIGTYVAKAMESELSGNVIDICPVGALTAKPSRYSGRSWEFTQHPGVAPHDSVGSNIWIHSINGQVKRVVPRENESVNEVWISDRDRFSYQGIYHGDRALMPRVKGADSDWETALAASAAGLKKAISEHGTDGVGFLVSPNATVEEMYLAQKIARALGVSNIDHRLRQGDFSAQDHDPAFPWLGQSLADLEKLDAALLVGSNIRLEQPLAGHRLRKAAMAGAKISFISSRDYEVMFPVAEKHTVSPSGMLKVLAAAVKAGLAKSNTKAPDSLSARIDSADRAVGQSLFDQLADAESSSVLLGNQSVAHPGYGELRALAALLAELTNSKLGYLPEAANSVGGAQLGLLPHRGPAAAVVEKAGLNTTEMIEKKLKGWVLIGFEPEFDCTNGAALVDVLKNADFVLNVNTYRSANAGNYSDVLLPASSFAETSGTFVNAEGVWQGFHGAGRPPGESRPAWKILRVLGNALDVPGFDYVSSEDVAEEARVACAAIVADNVLNDSLFGPSYEAPALERIGDVPIYCMDSTVRRAESLQQTPLAVDAAIYLSPRQAESLGLVDGGRAKVKQGEREAEFKVVVDDSIATDCVWIPAGLPETAKLGAMCGEVEVGPA